MFTEQLSVFYFSIIFPRADLIRGRGNFSDSYHFLASCRIFAQSDHLIIPQV
uniref:Uncharacterized protein n=2 Tax=Anguilla anguilla TaxID=7936 RepID=A0A0E9PPM4_ANGAN